MSSLQKELWSQFCVIDQVNTFLLNGKKDMGWNFLANLPKETLAHNAKMVFAPDVDEDYDAEIVIGK